QLEPMVLVPKARWPQTLEVYVVLRVRSRKDDGAGAGELEQDALERPEARRVEMLDDLDERRRVETREPLVAVEQAPVQQRHPLPLALRHRFELEAVAGTL